MRAGRDEAIMSPGWFDGRSGARRWTSWARERAERGSTITDERVGAALNDRYVSKLFFRALAEELLERFFGDVSNNLAAL